ncbi:MAG: hypothetical protein PW792_17175 [Acidobacteriaceae bacterium]|nr:hypothetical protein [Acidobacteriaceae bacterium]
MYLAPLFSSHGRRSIFLALQRAPRDRKARRSLLLLLGSAVYFAAVAGWFLHEIRNFHDQSIVWLVVGVVVSMIALAVAGQWQWQRLEDNRRAKDVAAAPRVIVDKLERLTQALAAMIERSLGEEWLLRNTLPEDHEVVMRRISLERLRAHSVWDEMPSEARTWLMHPNGSWPRSKTVMCLQRAELLHTLLWAMAYSSNLREVERLHEPLSFKQISRKLEKPALGIRPLWALREACDAAEVYFWRCNSEQIYRRHVLPDNHEIQADAILWAEAVREEPKKDMWAGKHRIAEVDRAKLAMITLAAGLRYQGLSLVMSLQEKGTEKAWRELSTLIYDPLMPDSAAESVVDTI